jgi:hypothetical protein
MGALLPDRSSGVYWHLLLPEYLGGLGLWLDEDIPDLTIRLPDPSKRAIAEVITETISRDDLALIKGFTSNKSYRGYILEETEVTLAREYIILDLLEILRSDSVRNICLEENIPMDISLKAQLSRLKKKGWLTAEELEDQILRPFLFKEILSKEAKVSAFNTETFKRRYSRVWDLYFTGHVTLSDEDVTKALRFKINKPLYYTGDKMVIPIRGVDRECSLIDEATLGLPDLSIQWIDVGLLTNPVNDLEGQEAEEL